MKHPLAAVPPRKRAAVITALLFLTLAAMLALNILGAPLRNSAAPSGIVAYELAGTVGKAQMILDSWDVATKVYAGFNLGLDYLFLLAYSPTIALGIVWLAEVRQLSRLALTSAGLLAWGQGVAAVLDAVENAALLIMLVDQAAEPWPLVARWCAIPKFALIALGILFVLAGSAVHLLRRRR